MQVKQRIKGFDNYYMLIIIHIIFGTALYFREALSTPIFLILMVYFIQRIIIVPDSEKTRAVLLGCAYFVGIEVLFRITRAGISYEASKYLVVLFMLMGMFFKGISGKGYPYFIYLIALVPAILVASVTLTFDARFRTNVTFVLSGPICLGISALFLYDRKVTKKTLMDIMLCILLPTISLTTYLFLYTPSVKEVLSSVASNRAASGGFGPNQVATALGLGMFAIVVRLFLKSPNVFLKALNLIILIAMSFRAIVTFSRGGVIAAILVIGAFLGNLFYRSSGKQKNQIIVSFALFVMAAAATWVISSNQTMGLIDKRYQNQDAIGREKQDLTTGRVELFVDEIEGFLSSPFLGIGASRTKDKRLDEEGELAASHNEIGRLLSEHGTLGILILLILI
ncbi:MAG: O-antigen ligase family protein, partial [Saprospiraceae bacterium]|nr:O-antigen ligase family protein [Saprospiraceae bacterium]